MTFKRTVTQSIAFRCVYCGLFRGKAELRIKRVNAARLGIWSFIRSMNERQAGSSKHEEREILVCDL